MKYTVARSPGRDASNCNRSGFGHICSYSRLLRRRNGMDGHLDDRISGRAVTLSVTA